MSLTRQIAHNTIYQIIGKIVSTVIGLVAIGMIGRYLGQEGMGYYTTIIAFLQFFGILVDMGLYIILVKKISEPETDVQKIVSNIFTLRLFSAVIFLGLAPLLVLFFPYPSIIKWGVAITSFSFLFITLNQVLTGLFQKNLRMDKIAYAEVLGRTALLAGTILAVTYHASLLYIMISVVIGSFANFLAVFFFARKYIRIKLSYDFDVWKDVLRNSWPIAISILFNLVYFKADTVILSLIKSQSDVGIYGASYKVLEVLSTFPAMFAGLMMPLLSKSYKAGDMERFKMVIRKAFDTLVIIAVPMVVFTYFIADQLMVFIFGEDFRIAGSVLKILIIATAVIFTGTLFGNAVVAVNRQKQIIWAYAVIAVISVAGYLIFIPSHSYFGAAWMTVASEFLITFASGYLALKAAKATISFRNFSKALLASMGMAAAFLILKNQSLLIAMTCAIFAYAGILYLLKGVTKELIMEVISLKPKS